MLSFNTHTSISFEHRVAKTENPLVSIIMPTYNNAHFLPESLAAILKQTFRDFEIIIVDDGSTDDTETVVQPYRSSIRFFRKENGGPAAARNLGIKNANGQLIAFLDADDLWLKDKLEIQVNYLNENPAVGLVFTDAVRFDAEGKFRPSFRETYGYVPSEKMFEQLLFDHFIAMSSVMVRRRCLEDVGLFDESLTGAEDYNLYLRLAKKYEFGFLDNVMVHVRLHGASLSDNLEQMCEDEIKNLDKIVGLFPDAEIPKRKLAGRIYARFGRYYFSQQRFAEARDCFTKAFLHAPLQVETWPFFFLASLPQEWRDSFLSLNKSFKKSVP
jgi:glycosyltransferase involved in cell wall biosynthesis